MIYDLCKRLRPLYGTKIDHLWLEHETTSSIERKREIEQLITLLAIKRLGIGLGEERIVLDPPPSSVIGDGEYTLGAISYPGLDPYPVRIKRNELLRHVFLLGPTGTGKSTFILGLLLQLLADRLPFMIFDFKRNYRCLLTSEHAENLLVLTVGRTTAPLTLNAINPPAGIAVEEWAESLSDTISTSYLLLQGARNVLKEALLRAHRDHPNDATLRHAHDLLQTELKGARAGSRRYGWLESSTRALEELTKGGFGNALNTTNGTSLTDLLAVPVVFELEGLGDDQKTFFCLFALQAVLLIRKQGGGQREVLHHALVFDESHNVFPRERPGELGVPSRLAREVREYGEAIIAATQQADVSESLIANSGIKIILRTDYPKDVQFASQLLQVDTRWLPRLPLGTAFGRLPVRYYMTFLLCFPPQPIKNTTVADASVEERWAEHTLGKIAAQALVAPAPAAAPSATEKEHELLLDINERPISPITQRYTRLGWNPKTGNNVKDTIIAKRLAVFTPVTTPTGVVKILGLTAAGEEYLRGQGVVTARGRHGGPEHEYWKAVVRNRLERHGYTVTDEAPVGSGKTVDLQARRDGQQLWVEVETGRSDIPANMAKLATLPGRKVVLFTSTTVREVHAGALANALGPEVLVLVPSELDRMERLPL